MAFLLDEAVLRVDVLSTALGMAPPRCPLQVRFLRTGGELAVVVDAPAAHSRQAAAWLARHTAASPSGALRQVLDPPPGAWRAWLDTGAVAQVDLWPSGLASVFTHGGPEAYARFLGLLAAAGGRPARSPMALTPRQLDILRRAVAAGYYEIPHRTSLRALAAAMRLSPGAASHLLRRAEARVVRDFVALARSPTRPGPPAATLSAASSQPAAGPATPPPAKAGGAPGGRGRRKAGRDGNMFAPVQPGGPQD